MFFWSILEAWTWFSNVPFLGAILLPMFGLVTLISALLAAAAIFFTLKFIWDLIPSG